MPGLKGSAGTDSTSGNDIINGYLNYVSGAPGTGTTYSASDVIDGGAGTDTLHLTIEGALATGTKALPVATIANVEKVYVRNVGVGATPATDIITVNADNIPGMTEFWVDRSTAVVGVTNLATGATFGVKGNGTVSNYNSLFGYKSDTAAITIAIADGVKAGNITGNSTTGTDAATTATITSTGAANTVGTVDLIDTTATLTSLTIDAATNLKGVIAGQTQNDFAANSTLTVKGAAASVELTAALANNIKTIDASGMTAGGLTAILGTGVTAFTGGAGADVITTAATTATGAVISGGAGTADILDLASTNDVTTSAKAGQYTNFEILRNSKADTAVDASLFTGITSVQLNADGAGFQKMTAEQAANVTNRTNNTTATLTLASAAGTSDVLTVTLNNPTTTPTSADLTNVDITGFETMNIVSISGSASDKSAVSFKSGGVASLKTIAVSGANHLNLSLANTVNAVTVTSTQTGTAVLDVAGAVVKGSSITTTANADTIETGTSAITGTSGDFVTYDAGAGNDSIISTVAAINNISGSNGSVKIDGGAGTDTLTIINGGHTYVDGNFQFLTNIEKIVLHKTAATAATTAISLEGGGHFNTNFKTQGIEIVAITTGNVANTINVGSTFEGNAKITLTANNATTNAKDQTVTTGSGNDTITVSATGLTTGEVLISSGAGNDTISVTFGTALTSNSANIINGGAGQDSITFAGVAATDSLYISVGIGAGHSTLAAYDTITGYKQTNGGTNLGMKLDFDGSADKAAQVTSGAVAGYTSGELTYSVSSTGVLSFTGTSAAALTNATKATIAQTVITAADAVVVWTDGTDAWVFHNDANGDSLVKLAGITTVDGVSASANTANFITVA